MRVVRVKPRSHKFFIAPYIATVRRINKNCINFQDARFDQFALFFHTHKNVALRHGNQFFFRKVFVRACAAGKLNGCLKKIVWGSSIIYYFLCQIFGRITVGLGKLSVMGPISQDYVFTSTCISSTNSITCSWNGKEIVLIDVYAIMVRVTIIINNGHVT